MMRQYGGQLIMIFGGQMVCVISRIKFNKYWQLPSMDAYYMYLDVHCSTVIWYSSVQQQYHLDLDFFCF